MSWVLPDRVSGKILDMLQAGAEGLAALKSGRAVLLITLSSVAQWLLNGLIAYTALKAFHIPVTVTSGLIVTGVTAIGVTVPSTPGYFGVIQYCFRISMAAQGLSVDPSLVLGASLYYHISMYIPVTLSGLYFLNSLGLHFSDMTRAAHVPSDADAVDSDATNAGEITQDAPLPGEKPAV